MSDPYAWGLWKTFNVMVLTGLGSGGFAVGIAAWVFNRTKLHPVMRVALLTSFWPIGPVWRCLASMWAVPGTSIGS